MVSASQARLLVVWRALALSRALAVLASGLGHRLSPGADHHDCGGAGRIYGALTAFCAINSSVWITQVGWAKGC